MAIDNKYGKITVEKEPGNPLNDTDEPVFLLRARDKIALPAILYYMDTAAHRGSSEEFMVGLEEVEKSFADWQEANHELVKLPD